MKTILALTVTLILMVSANAWAVATISLNNYDSGNPIYYHIVGTLVPVEATYVQLQTPRGPVTPIGSDSSIIPLSEPGFFYAGIGIVPGLTDGATTEFTLRVWRGALSFEAATEVGLYTWTQTTGSWNPDAVPPTPPIGSSLQNPVIVFAIPEPSTVVLGLIGAAAMLILNWKR